MAVATIDSTVTNIRTKVRRLTASKSTLQLSNDDLDEYINTAYVQDMPADIKSWLFKEVVEVYTAPNVDKYVLAGTLAANESADTFESIREPIYVDGRRARFYKDRGQFYNDFPRTASLDTSLTGDGATTAFSLNVGAPILQNELTIGVKIGGVQNNFEDDGDLAGTGTGNIVNVVGGAVNGTVVYETGVITLAFVTPPDASETISVSFYTYTASRPYAVLWWRDELFVRPVPDRGYRIELEAYRFPTQFTDETETPTIKQWWQYISLLAAIKVLQDRQDMEGVENLVPLVDRQETLIRNRKANEQIGQRNTTIYEGSDSPQIFPYGFYY
jgi:hypothetical protein